jgi:hypothetical protein
MISSHLFPNYDWTNEKHMATFAESLLTRNFGIQYPEPAPTMTHKIKADVVFRMFNNILRPLLIDINADDETIRAHDEAVESMAFDALWATCLLLHKRGETHLHTLYAKAANLPVDGFGKFPVYVAALIDDFGPVRGLNGVIHVPYLLYDEVQALKPQTYAASHRKQFFTLSEAGNFASFDEIDTSGPKAFSAWWTFHAFERGEPLQRLRSFSVWSPLPFKAVKPHLKLAVVFAEDRLTEDIGLVAFSTTPFYHVPALDKHNQTAIDPLYLLPNSIGYLPGEAWEYPCFGCSAAVYYSIIEGNDEYSGAIRRLGGIVFQRTPCGIAPTKIRYTGDEATDTDPERIQEDEYDPQPDEQSDRENITPSVGDSSTIRLIHHYFDHCVVSNVNTDIRDDWARKLEGCNPSHTDIYKRWVDSYYAKRESKGLDCEAKFDTWARPSSSDEGGC